MRSSRSERHANEHTNLIEWNAISQSNGGGKMLIVHEERGQGLVEYALLLMLVAMVVLIVLIVFGGQVGNLFSRISNTLGTLP